MSLLTLDDVQNFLQKRVRPAAQTMDRSPEVLREALEGLIELGAMSLRRPAEYGGPAWPEADFRAFQELICRYSGALAFLQTQHQSAVSLISKSKTEVVKQRYLPGAHRRDGLIGIGFSQLRRPGPPTLRATDVEGGYRIDGHLPWATGFSMFPHLLIGAELPDRRAVFGVVPFENRPGIQYSEPMRLAAVEAAQTVEGQFDGWFLGEDDVVDIKPADWIHRNDMINIALQGFFALGCAMAGLDILRERLERKPTEAVQSTHDALEAEVSACRAQMTAQLDGQPEETTAEKLRTRAWAIELAVRCAHAAVTVSSGAANSADHPAQRVYREAIVFTVSAQTQPILEATLDRLTRPASRS